MNQSSARIRALSAAVLLTAVAAAPALAFPPKPKLSINDVTLAEGNGGTVAATFTVTLSFASANTVSATFKTANGTATSPADYIGTVGTLSFPPGTTSTTVTVQVNGDNFDEPNETFLVNLTKPKNATFLDKQGVGTIVDDDVTPALSINDVTVTEGNSGATNALFTLSLSAPSGQNVTVNIATQDGTATAGVDYVPQAGTVTFPPGTISLAVAVPVFGDVLGEPNETFLVNLSGAANATIADGQGQGTIIDDDALPAISINDATVVEGDSGTTNAAFIVSLSSPSGQTVSVNYSTQDGTATAGSDYTAASGTLTFPPGTTVLPLAVSVIGDAAPEANETFLVNLSGPANATIADGQGLGTIADDDTGVVLFINDVAVTEGNAGTVNATFTVSLSSGVGQQVTVDFATADGTATAPADYVAGAGTLTFPPGSTTQNVTVAVKGDLLDEANETFLVNLSNSTNATIADGTGVGTINDDDAPPALSIGDAAVTEGDGSPVNIVFTVSLGAPSGQTVTVNYGTADGTAVAGVDYVATGGTVTFPPGTVTQTATVSVLGDVLDEADETFFVNLTNPANATVADGQGLGTIQDNDPGPSLSIDDVSDGEGDSGVLNDDFTVILSTASGQVVTVGFATANGTATAGSDYVATTGTLTFPVGTTRRTVSVPINGDTTVEPNEDFFVNLQNPVNATIADGQGHGTILNDDGITIAINDVTVSEGDSGTVNAVFSVDLSDIAATDVTVDFATADGTATAGVDYLANSGSLLFPPGTTSLPVTVTVNGDDVAEPAETFFVNLTNPSGATIFDDQGVGTIAGGDGAGELVHGFEEIYNLAALPGPSAAVSLFRIDQKPRSSYEIVVDSTSGDIGDAGSPLAVDRLDSDGATVVQSAQAVGIGFSRSLRWENSSVNEIGDEFVRVQSTECTTDCGTDDQYRIQAYETTYSIPRFNNAGTQITVVVLENPAQYAIHGTLWFWNSGGILLASQTFTLNSKAVLVLNTSGVPGLSGKSGAVTISHDGRYADLLGKTVALEPSTGFSFDSPMEPRVKVNWRSFGP